MKIRWVIILLLSAAMAVFLMVRPRGPADSLTPEPESRPDPTFAQQLEYLLPGAGTTNPLHYPRRPPARENVPLFQQKPYAQSLLEQLDPELFRKYEGSYTFNELRARNAAETPSVSVNSSWVFGGSAPQAGLTVQRNPLTGQYEVSGGELFLPNSGMGLSYEKDAESGETRTYLNLKKEF